jgi:hypothetical protein
VSPAASGVQYGREFIMKHALGICLALLGLALFVGSSVALAADETHQGTLVKAENGKLTMTDTAGKEHSHNVADNAQITLDGKACKLEDLKRGFKLKVTTKEGDPNTAIKIEATKE